MAHAGPSSSGPAPDPSPIGPPPLRDDEEQHTYPPRTRDERPHRPRSPEPEPDPYEILDEPLPEMEHFVPDSTLKVPPSRPALPFPPLGDENLISPPPHRTLQFGLTPYDHDREDRRTLLQEREANDRQARLGTKQDNRQIFQERASDQRNDRNIHAADRRTRAEIAAADARTRAEIEAADRRNQANLDAADRLNWRDNAVRLGVAGIAATAGLGVAGFAYGANGLRADGARDAAMIAADGARDAARIAAGEAIESGARNHPRDFRAPAGVELHHNPRQVAPGIKPVPVLPPPNRLRAGAGSRRSSRKGTLDDLD
ncbi:hypothetical protein G647_10226 [Cladophialophora carrionii CBS 160.54]|uniref:Uncharacterized protein n=1 Tax=Cladophialophora carrionii CBS 160.54 TaxID=1279043 RepID=V9DJ81_9EURO|nr:uncharacterized protein G647_10226 [Cladophialophora carrionii CBS 160.54]ETI26781.1 hypothetical protein G647_10226 [Cladophialophora carrionii CBS 160.54]